MDYLNEFTSKIDEKGFVFLDLNSRPYLVRRWGDGVWIFYWHKDRHWVSLRQLASPEIVAMFDRKLPPERAELYHKLHRQWEEKHPLPPAKLADKTEVYDG